LKLIGAVITGGKVDEVISALQAIGVEENLCLSAVLCHGRAKGRTVVYRGAQSTTNLVEKVKLEVMVAEEILGSVVEAIGNAAKTQRRADCLIYVYPVCLLDAHVVQSNNCMESTYR
jgi:nitrogen regulatory protein PII